VTTARKRITEGRYDPTALLDHELTHTLWAPLPWYEGKQAAIHTYIHPWKRPVLVAGDYITIESGTGLGHTAPGHGVDEIGRASCRERV
jgi:isoleucyl-tRNA synthetase